MKLDPRRSAQVIDMRIVETIGLDRQSAALGILAIANSNMLRALRLVSAVRGYDPREYALVCFGGAGPLHAAKLAEELEIGTVVAPRSPGVTCALGLLVTDVQHDYMQTSLVALDARGLEEIRAVIAKLRAHAVADLSEEGFSGDRAVLAVSADVRYRGQAYELTVPVPAGEVDKDWAAKLAQRFHERHTMTYGHSSPELPVEVVSLRVAASGLVPKPHLQKIPAAKHEAAEAKRTERKVWFDRAGPVTTAIYDRYKLRAGHHFIGPAIVEEMDSTVVVYPGWTATVDDFANIIMRRATETST
jgi:N-methylhydantoinase A